MGLDNLPDVVTLSQLAEFVKFSKNTIYRAIKEEKLEAFKIGRDWRIEKSAVLKWIKRNNAP